MFFNFDDLQIIEVLYVFFLNVSRTITYNIHRHFIFLFLLYIIIFEILGMSIQKVMYISYIQRVYR